MVIYLGMIPSITGSQCLNMNRAIITYGNDTPTQITIKQSAIEITKYGLFGEGRSFTKEEASCYKKALIKKATPTGRRIIF